MRNILISILCFQLILALPIHTFAQSNANAFLDFNDRVTGGSADYIVKRHPNQKLMPVRLIGGVSRPGFYQIPEDTSLLSLLSYSGGATKDADIEEVIVWRDDKNESVKIDLDKILKDPNANDPKMQANDVLFIKEKKQIISTNALIVITVLSTIAGTILTSMIIGDKIVERR